jgi:hypothetical protein
MIAVATRRKSLAVNTSDLMLLGMGRIVNNSVDAGTWHLVPWLKDISHRCHGLNLRLFP